MLADLRPKGVTGKATEAALGRAHITCNKNGVPFDPEKPFVTSGIRLGTPAGTTRGFGEPSSARSHVGSSRSSMAWPRMAKRAIAEVEARVQGRSFGALWSVPALSRSLIHGSRFMPCRGMARRILPQYSGQVTAPQQKEKDRQHDNEDNESDLGHNIQDFASAYSVRVLPDRGNARNFFSARRTARSSINRCKFWGVAGQVASAEMITSTNGRRRFGRRRPAFAATSCQGPRPAPEAAPTYIRPARLIFPSRP